MVSLTTNRSVYLYASFSPRDAQEPERIFTGVSQLIRDHLHNVLPSRNEMKLSAVTETNTIRSAKQEEATTFCNRRVVVAPFTSEERSVVPASLRGTWYVRVELSRLHSLTEQISKELNQIVSKNDSIVPKIWTWRDQLIRAGLSFALTFVGIAILCLGTQMILRDEALRSRGISTNATIVEWEQSSANKERWLPVVAYYVGQENFEKLLSEGYSSSEKKTMKEISIVYDPERPSLMTSQHKLQTQPLSFSLFFLLILTFLPFSFGLSGFYTMVRRPVRVFALPLEARYP